LEHANDLKKEGKKECIMGKYKQTFELKTNSALAGNGLHLQEVGD